jgi:N-acetylglucosamine-6-sulfatase
VHSTPLSLRPGQTRLSALFVGILAVLVITGALTSRVGAQETYAPHPNVVVLMTDDQGPEMMRALPTVTRRIARRGVTFTEALVSYPLCCPSRATFLTGEYAHNHGTKGNNVASGGGYKNLLAPNRNLAAWLQGAGYNTHFIGKWLNGLRQPHRGPPGWTTWNALVGAGGDGLSSFYDYDVFGPDGNRHYGTQNLDYQTDALTRDYAVPIIDAEATDPAPFFLWFAYHPPHFGVGRDDRAGRRCSIGPPDERASKQSAIPPPRYADRFPHTPVPQPPSFDERDVSDKPKFVRRHPRLSVDDVARITRDYRCGLAALLAVDDSVRAIIDALARSGQLDDTVIVFTTDNGVLAGQHRIPVGKNRPYEEAIDVPLFIRGPGIARGGQVAAPVANVDLAPTILELAGASLAPEVARPIDGVSLVSDLQTGLGLDPNREVLIEGRDDLARARHGYKVLSYVGVRTLRYAYIQTRRASTDSRQAAKQMAIGAGRTTGVELYDLQRDPYELENRARDPAYAAVRAALAGQLDRLASCSGANCVVGATIPSPSRPLNRSGWIPHAQAFARHAR